MVDDECGPQNRNNNNSRKLVENVICVLISKGNNRVVIGLLNKPNINLKTRRPLEVLRNWKTLST